MLNGEATGSKKKTIEKHRRNAKDVGSTEVQVALITDRLNQLSAHFEHHKKDEHSKRGMLRLVAQRNGLLGYLKSSDITRYRELVTSLGLRK